MFENDYTIYGKHAKFLKFLAKKNARDDGPETSGSAKIFERYIDVYMNAVVFGLIYSRKAKRDTESDDRSNTAHILANVFIRERENCIFLYQMVMLLDTTENLSLEEKINRAFRIDSTLSNSEEFQKNMELFNDYVRGGIEVMYEKFTDGCRTPEEYLERTFEIITNFQDEINGVSFSDRIEKLINK